MKLSRILGAVALVLAIALIATGIVGNTFRSGDHALAKDYQEAISHEASTSQSATPCEIRNSRLSFTDSGVSAPNTAAITRQKRF